MCNRVLIGQIEGNFSTLSANYQTLRSNLSSGESLSSDLDTSLTNSTISLDASAAILSEVEPLLETAKSNLLGISSRLAMFEERINASLREIVKARSLTTNATDYSRQIASVSEMKTTTKKQTKKTPFGPILSEPYCTLASCTQVLSLNLHSVVNRKELDKL